jgi:hypothetical protein
MFFEVKIRNLSTNSGRFCLSDIVLPPILLRFYSLYLNQVGGSSQLVYFRCCTGNPHLLRRPWHAPTKIAMLAMTGLHLEN